MNNFENDVPKYHKKKNGTKSKSKNKTDHKHAYEECFIQYDFVFNCKVNTHTSLCSYCIICGKINSALKDGKIRSQYHDSKTEQGYIIPWINDIDKIHEKHKDEIPTFHVKDMMSKYVDIREKYGFEPENIK